MPYATRLIREARADAAEDDDDAEFRERLLGMLGGDQAVRRAVRALAPAPVPAKQPPRTPRR